MHISTLQSAQLIHCSNLWKEQKSLVDNLWPELIISCWWLLETMGDCQELQAIALTEENTLVIEIGAYDVWKAPQITVTTNMAG
jgi:hypothetical protein